MLAKLLRASPHLCVIAATQVILRTVHAVRSVCLGDETTGLRRAAVEVLVSYDESIEFRLAGGGPREDNLGRLPVNQVHLLWPFCR